jgi:hypothetical protein
MYLALKEKGKSTKAGKCKQGPLVKEGYRSVYRFFVITSGPILMIYRQAIAGMAVDGEE